MSHKFKPCDDPIRKDPPTQWNSYIYPYAH